MRLTARAMFGLAGLACGVWLLISSGNVLLAEPSACPCTDESEATKSCESGKTQCTASVDEAGCKAKGHFMVNSFPSECLKSQPDRLCSTNDADCYLETLCTWDPTESPPCTHLGAPGGSWTPKPKPKGGDCTKKGGQCPAP